MKKVIGESMSNEDNNTIQYCKNCYNIKDCNCEKPEYIRTWDFVYWAFKNLKM